VMKGICFFFQYPDSNLSMHACHPAVSYILTGFAGYSVGCGINRDTRKLTGHPGKSKKKWLPSLIGED
jgi:hypothetical protein